MNLQPPDEQPSSVYVATDLNADTTDVLASAALEGFRHGDDSVCIWVDQAIPHRVWVSFGLETGDLEDAMSQGLSHASEIRALLPSKPRTTEVTAYTEASVLRWTPED